MIKKIKKHSNLLINKLHLSFFGHEISDRMVNFLINLSWSFFGGVIASAMMFAINILAGRALGPQGFGQYNSILSLASAFSIFVLLGNDSSSVRYISDQQYENRKKEIFSASFWLTFFQFILLTTFIFLFNKKIEVLSIDNSILTIGLFFSLTLAIKTLTDSYLRAFHLYKKQSLIRIITAGIAFLSFVLLFYVQNFHTYNYLILALIIGDLAFIFVGFSFFYKNFSRFRFDDIKLLFHYNKYLMFGTIAFTLVSLEQYFIGRFVGLKELGIYSAYWYGSFLVISHFCVYFNNIFWPDAIKNKHRMLEILKKAKTVTIKGLPIWFLLDLVFLVLILFLFGKSYSLRIDYILLFPISAYTSGVYLIFMHLLYIDQIKLSSIVAMVVGIFLIAFLAVFKNLPAYLVFQMFLYTGISLFVFKRLKREYGN